MTNVFSYKIVYFLILWSILCYFSTGSGWGTQNKKLITCLFLSLKVIGNILEISLKLFFRNEWQPCLGIRGPVKDHPEPPRILTEYNSLESLIYIELWGWATIRPRGESLIRPMAHSGLERSVFNAEKVF